MTAKQQQLIEIAAAVYILCDEKREKRKRSIWTRPWIQRRDDEGCCVKLLRELSTEDPVQLSNFLRMSAENFNRILDLVTPFIQKEDTQLRRAIPASERLALTLRFLATGDSFASLQYTFRMPPCTCSRIIPEVLDALYNVLVGDYLTVHITNCIVNVHFLNIVAVFFRRQVHRTNGKKSPMTFLKNGSFRMELALWMGNKCR